MERPERDCGAASSYRDTGKPQDLDFHPLLEKLNLLDDEHLIVVIHRLYKSSLLCQGRCIRENSCTTIKY